MTMHGEPQPPRGLKGGSGDVGMQSYQVPIKVQGEAGYACDRGAQRCMGTNGATGRLAICFKCCCNCANNICFHLRMVRL